MPKSKKNVNRPLCFLAVVDLKKLETQLREIDQIINSINPISDMCLEELQPADHIKEDVIKKNKKEKMEFEEVLNHLLNRDFKNIRGVKLDYTEYSNSSEVISFITSNTKEKILKSTTLLDLNLLYFLLSGDQKEIKKKKEELYDMITGHIKANKQGEAFNKFTKR